jgi:hypothetical protein
MRRMLEKNGFVHCGTIYLENGDERVAYEKMIIKEDYLQMAKTKRVAQEINYMEE